MAVPCEGSSTGIDSNMQPMHPANSSNEHQPQTRQISHTTSSSGSSSSSRICSRSRSSSSCWFTWRPSRNFLLAVLALLVLQAAVAVNVIYDETGWTKVDWHKYKIDFDLNVAADPADEVLKSPEAKKLLTEAHINSLHGPAKRKTVNKFAGLWSRDDGSLVASPTEDAVEQAAEAVMCTTCHSLVSHVWGQLVQAVNRAEPISESYVKDLIEDACESQVPSKVLNKYRIVQVEAPELDVSLFVVRDRKGLSSSSSKGTKELPAAASKDGKGAATITTSSSSKGSSIGNKLHDGIHGEMLGEVQGSGEGDTQSPTQSLPADVTTAEAEAVQKACTDLSMNHVSAMQKQMWPKVREYFQERLTLAQKVLTKAAWYNDDSFWEPDAYEDPDDDYVIADRSLSMSTIKLAAAQKLTAADKLCLDMDVMCPFWAQQGQCKANPTYMVGDKTHTGHCKASCKACSPKTIWKKHPVVKQELRKAAAAAGQLLRTSACSASKACMAGGSSTIAAAAAVKEGGSLLPGAVLAKTPGFVLGKPFWAVPTVSIDPTGGLKPEQRETDVTKHDPADEVLLSDGLGHKFVSIPGMDNFFTYQLEYKRRVYQFAKDKNTQAIKEDHTLGTYDRAATAAAAVNDKVAATRHPEIARAWTAQWKLQQAASKHASGAAAAAAAGDGEDWEKAPPAPPMLELLDYLPDTESMLASHWPYMRQMYTKGATCIVDGKPVARQVELRAACSPDSSMHMLVREPAFCSYIMVLYHPTLCEVDRLKPVPVLGSSSSNGSSSGSSGGGSSKESVSGKGKASNGGGDGSSGGNKDSSSSSSSSSSEAEKQGKGAAAAAKANRAFGESSRGKVAGDESGRVNQQGGKERDAKVAESGDDSSQNKKLSTS